MNNFKLAELHEHQVVTIHHIRTCQERHQPHNCDHSYYWYSRQELPLPTTMAKDKDRAMNPALAQHRHDKQKALKKGKAEALARRNEKLARRNPDRIQRQIDELKSLEAAAAAASGSGGQSFRPRDKQLLEALERDLRAVLKAREALGDKAPTFPSQRRDAHYHRDGEAPPSSTTTTSTLGKRRRGADDRRDNHHHNHRHPHRRFSDEQESDDDGSETDESVRRIPMPRDTPPPIPPQYLRRKNNNNRRRDLPDDDSAVSSPHPLPAKPPPPTATTTTHSTRPETKTVYEAAPEIRNLRQEAVSKFVPAAVRLKQNAIKGQGKLLEPEEMDRLERAGYKPAPQKLSTPAAVSGSVSEGGGGGVEAVDPEQQRLRLLEEEERRFNQELRSVQIEDVEDEEDA